ncbi:DUF1853 family protein [Pareuzebyella sediminis]|uniref:DUF1853 family protein n=1 Tax=Pareuzebyella sediminis TaxID=2607998 RepID=UPI0011EBE898|nr:DUF1853 family protein [Pareuzebyella sediminis]
MVEKQCIGFMSTPPLWVNAQFGVVQFEFPEIDLKRFRPDPIPTNLRLGHQIEYIFAQLIENSVNYSIAVQNLLVKKDLRTVGEIDFILVKSDTNQLVHVELTYKFYIIDPLISEPVHRLMGPNKRDMFFTKLEKIKTQQFKLLHTKEGIEALRPFSINPSELEHQTCFKAQLFIPYQYSSLNIRPLNQRCVSGFWLNFDQFRLSEFQEHSYYIPKKSEWIVEPYLEVKWKSHYDTLLDVNVRMIQQSSPLVWVKKPNNQFEKFFVVWF